MELLLLSNSTLPGEPFFQWPRAYVAAYLNGRKRLAFVPFAAPPEQQDAYVEKVSAVFTELGIELVSLHGPGDPLKTLDQADAVAVGGGNTFLLLRTLYRTGLVKAITEKVRKGMPYVGWSAGSNVACPTIMTTNDMPIVEPPSMHAMNLVPFQINPHYLDANPAGHAGETREQRIEEFIEVNPAVYVVGLREGTMLHLEKRNLQLIGPRKARIFRKGEVPVEAAAGDKLSFLLRH